MAEAWTPKSWSRDLCGIKSSPGTSLSHSQHQSLDSELPVLLLAPLFLDPAQPKFKRTFLSMYNSWFMNYLALATESSELVFKVTKPVRPVQRKIFASTFLENKKPIILLGIIPFPWLYSGPGNKQKYLIHVIWDCGMGLTTSRDTGQVASSSQWHLPSLFTLGSFHSSWSSPRMWQRRPRAVHSQVSCRTQRASSFFLGRQRRDKHHMEGVQLPLRAAPSSPG